MNEKLKRNAAPELSGAALSRLRFSRRLEKRGRTNSQIKDKCQVKARRHEPNAAPKNAVAAFHALRCGTGPCSTLWCSIS
jgi:hypothetical protein